MSYLASEKDFFKARQTILGAIQETTFKVESSNNKKSDQRAQANLDLEVLQIRTLATQQIIDLSKEMEVYQKK